MPNWVNNVVTITGSSNDVQAFLDHIAIVPKFAEHEQGETPKNTFSFHSFVTPKDMTLEEYLGVDSNGMGRSGGKWYDWNNIHWNTKWDACHAEVDSSPGEVTLRFDTAWGAPSPVIEAMSAKFPNLDIQVWWEEEQGFGEEYHIRGSIVTNYIEWDIPSCHADYEERGREGDCVCGWDDDVENWYEDCPGKTKHTYIVEVVTKYYVAANNEQDAIEAAKAEESGYDLPAGATVKTVEYSEEYRSAGVQEVDVDEPEVRVVSG